MNFFSELRNEGFILYVKYSSIQLDAVCCDFERKVAYAIFMSPNPKIEGFIDDICNRCSNVTFNIVQDENISGAKESERFCEDKK